MKKYILITSTVFSKTFDIVRRNYFLSVNREVGFKLNNSKMTEHFASCNRADILMKDDLSKSDFQWESSVKMIFSVSVIFYVVLETLSRYYELSTITQRTRWRKNSIVHVDDIFFIKYSVSETGVLLKNIEHFRRGIQVSFCRIDKQNFSTQVIQTNQQKRLDNRKKLPTIVKKKYHNKI